MDAPSETVWGTKVKPGGKVKACAVREMRGEGSFCPAVASRAALVREGRTALLFFAARAIPVAEGGWRTLGLVRALGYADHMSTHSRSFPAPRRGALHEEQAPQEADREEKKRSAPRRRSGGKASPEQGAERVLALGAKLVMVTLGPKGCFLKNAQAEYRCGCPQVRTVDTTGAGDIFGGSAVSRFLELGKTPEQLTQEDLAYMARYASAAASLSTEKSGAIPSIPAKEAVLQKMQEAY